MKKIPLIVIAGPTASGKTALGVEICKKINGEVISADSMQIYKGMDIATAKPSESEMQGIKHHLISIISPEETFSVADFKALAEKAINEIISKGKIPVVVGGTGLYIDTLVNNIILSDASADPETRKNLEKRAEDEGAQTLLDELKEIDPEYAASLHANNVKRIIRALELWQTAHITMTQQLQDSRREPSPYDTVYICLDCEDRDYLYSRINRRVDAMMQAGLLDEAQKYYSSCSPTAVQAIGYKELMPYFKNEKTLDEAVESLKQSTRRYAKRQLTWFRRHEEAERIYIDKYESFENLIEDAVNIIEKRMKGNGDE
ncbi:MAG: tRNA (adenosine(37)-N6)-dimethylallyltransferase MiaA [Clostridia bacterium]|nr:tRNA (adenosine(37)-N6)-dimethylallyltransferase MiaA [Clostridia bacterium]